MHPFLTRLGIHPDVQQFFKPFWEIDQLENLVFPYPNAKEYYGFGFHKVPVTDFPLVIGVLTTNALPEIVVCNSAMEGMAILHYGLSRFRCLGNLIVICTGAGFNSAHLSRIRQNIRGRSVYLAFGNDVAARIWDLKYAAAIRRQPVTVSLNNERAVITFRNRDYITPLSHFSLNAFEKLAGYRFNIRTIKPKGYNTFLNRLSAEAFL